MRTEILAKTQNVKHRQCLDENRNSRQNTKCQTTDSVLMRTEILAKTQNVKQQTVSWYATTTF